MGHLHLVLLVCITGLIPAEAQNEKQEPPGIQEPVVGGTREVRRDSPVTLNCRATGIPKPTFQWYFNDTPVSPNNPPLAPGVTVDISVDHRRGQLVIPSVKETMTGRYSCRASNRLPGDPSPVTAVSPPITIIVSYLDSWGVRENRDLRYDAYQYFKIDCDDVTTWPSHAGSIEYKWYRKPAVGKNIEVTATDRIFIDNKGTIHFTTFDPDQDYFNIPGSLPYSCGLSSSSIQFGGEVNLESVAGGDDYQKNQLPVLQYSSGQVTALNGSTARLECFFSGFPVPEIKWKDNTGKIIEAGFKYGLESKKRVLVINDVSAADEVAFTCMANNSQGYEEEILFPLNVTSPPYWVQPLMSQTIPQGRNVDFYCHAESMVHETPPGPPRWFKNGATLQTVDTPKYRFSDESRKLTVLNVQKPDDIACYQCIVSNSVGDTFGTACLNVLLPIQILTRPPEEQVISQGHKVNMTVQAIGDPLYPLSYVWLLNNRSLPMDTTTPSYYVRSSSGQLLYINTTGLSPEQMKNITGEYRCEVLHPYESKIVVISVRLGSDEVASAGFQWWIIGLILGILLLLIVLIICCCVVCRRKMQEGDYPVDKKETAAGLDPEKEVKESAFPDLSRADDPYQPKKPPAMDMDGHSIRDDESFASTEYGEEPTAFNEDGSFIGEYKSKQKPDKQPVENPAFQPAQPKDNPAFSPEYDRPGRENHVYPPPNRQPEYRPDYQPDYRPDYQPPYPRENHAYSPKDRPPSYQPRNNYAYSPGRERYSVGSPTYSPNESMV